MATRVEQGDGAPLAGTAEGFFVGRAGGDAGADGIYREVAWNPFL